ncbi:MBL fold metallo-hydrolase [Tersicoccus solisilvae]|nr:MBL fold metallo-hydrolase [Tersicoccus solisilvae]
MTRLALTRVTHSCHLLELGGLTILTDPWFSTREDYFPGERLAFTVDELPDLDAVVITHTHYDHCDFDAFQTYRDHAVPVVGPPSVGAVARDHGFTDVRELQPWQSTAVGDVTITAVPAAHGVEEITYVIGSPDIRLYFGGDTLLIPAITDLTEKVGPVEVALLPINGLKIRPMHELQVVMDAEDAARLAAILAPKLAIPHHYRFTSGEEGDRTITKSDRDPQLFVDAARRLAPDVEVRVTVPGERVEVP